MKVKSKVGMTYAGKYHKPGTTFTMKDRHGKVFIALGKVEEYVEPPKPRQRRSTTPRKTNTPSPAAKEAEENTEEAEEESSEEETTPNPSPSTGRYRRRDMTAED